jgi:alkylation response protein AidB-like acyl-CoA dehydrogenase
MAFATQLSGSVAARHSLFVPPSIATMAAAHDAEARFPHPSIAQLQDAGLLALTVPRRFGGSGGGLEDAAELLQSAGAACASTALILAMQLNRHGALAKDRRWPASARERVSRDAVRNGALLNALRVEPELGSPTRGGLPATIARPIPDGSWSLSGRKTYATGAPGLTWMEVWARTEEDRPRVGYLLVNARASGLRIEQSWNHLGMRATGSHDVVFEEVIVPAGDAVDLRAPEEWAEPDLEQAAWNAVGLGAVYTGIAQAARNWAARFLAERRPTGLGAALATLPRVQEKIGEVQSRLLVNARLISSAAAETDAGSPPSLAESFLLKTVLAENAVRAVEGAAALAGNHALSRNNPMERHLRDVLCARVHVPNEDAAHLAAGRALLSSYSI